MTDLDGVLGALADRNRRLILDRIAEHGAATATALADELPMSRQGVVQHLALLSDAGLIEDRRVGRERRFHVQPETLKATSRWMSELADAWDLRLAAIKSLAEEA